MNKKEKTKKSVLPNQAMLVLRGLIGFYLMYLAYDLICDESMVTPRPIIIIFSVIFSNSRKYIHEFLNITNKKEILCLP